jgi:hypothetical protein
MSEENVELIRRITEAVDRGDLDGVRLRTLYRSSNSSPPPGSPKPTSWACSGGRRD